MLHRPLIAFLLPTLLAGVAMAQDVRVYGRGELLNPAEVAAILAPAPPIMKMRSIRLLDEVAPVAPPDAPQQLALVGQISAGGVADAGTAPTQRTRETALSLPVQFAFDSADILPSARQQLDALADGIRMLPIALSVVIEGHTDAAGTEQYNEQLSQRRAYAVKRYLVAAHHIDPARLRAVGLGEFAPLVGRDPYTAENRRVQFRGE
jgi:OmpA-OmpF porin, OOP family